ncbi:MAG: serine hydrolase [Candidatus Poribacteria bacterium]|nr:serine hydrolase [Candidatus Poribacteria bacterium]
MNRWRVLGDVWSGSWIGVALAVVASVVLTASAWAQDAPTPTADGLDGGVYLKRWLVLAPLPIFEGEPDANDEATQLAAFERDYLSEVGGETGVAPKAGDTVKVGDHEYSWALVESATDFVDLFAHTNETEFAVAYAYAEVQLDAATDTILGVGSDDAVVVWLNGEQIHRNWTGRAPGPDQDIVPARFSSGKNTLLLKVQNGILGWGFYFRPLDGKALEEPFLLAAQRGDLKSVKAMADAGVDLNATAAVGLTAYQWASVTGRAEVAAYLAERGADTTRPMPSYEALLNNLLGSVYDDEDDPAVSFLVARDGKVIYQNAFGHADVEGDVGATVETKYRIGSITKQFTATAILQLMEAGKIALDDPLSKFYPDFPRGDEVTVYHLLTHTSGIHSYTGDAEFIAHVTDYIAPADLVERIKTYEYDFDPGAQWMYNNSGYFLLGTIVAQVSGEPSLGAYFQKHLFEPLGMANTGSYVNQSPPENAAKGYSVANGETRLADDWDMSFAGGAGDLYSTVGDLHIWNEAIFHNKVLKPETLNMAWTPAKLNDGSQASAFGSGYGFGWMIGTARDLKTINHGGGLPGWSTYILRVPDHSVTVVGLTNAAPGLADPGGLSLRAAEFLLWQEMKPIETPVEDETVSADTYDDYTGIYNYVNAVLEVTRQGDQLFAQLTGQPRFEIFPRSKDVFFWKVVDAEVSFLRDENGVVVKAHHKQGGAEFDAPKLDDTTATVDSALYDAYVGEYDYGRFRQ